MSPSLSPTSGLQTLIPKKSSEDIHPDVLLPGILTILVHR